MAGYYRLLGSHHDGAWLTDVDLRSEIFLLLVELVKLQIRGMAWTWNVGAGASGTQGSSARGRARVVARVATSPVCGGQTTWLPTSGASLVGPVGLKS